MPKLNVYKTSRTQVFLSDELDNLLEYYNEKSISKAINKMVFNQFEIIKESKKLKKRNMQLELANDLLIEKIKNS